MREEKEEEKREEKKMKLYRKSSPRTNRKYDSILVNKDRVNYYLSKGWLLDPPDTVKDKKAIRSIDDLTDAEIIEIRDAKGSIATVANKFNATGYAVRKIRANR